MRHRQLHGTTVLIVEPDLQAALDIQDRLADEGALVVTAYCPERAELLVQHPGVACVVARRAVVERNNKLEALLSQSQIPRVVYHRQMTADAILDELKMRVATEHRYGNSTLSPETPA